jgi:multidrug resistance efflux pump
MENFSSNFKTFFEEKKWTLWRINPLHCLWLVAVGLCYWIASTFIIQSEDTFFGSAETEGQTLTFEHPVLIEKVFVQVGNQVRKGDTLAICMRSDLDKSAVDKSGEIKQYNIEKQTKDAAIQQELNLLRARKIALVAELEAQIRMIKAEEGIQSALKDAISRDDKKQPNTSNLKTEKINTIRESIRQLELQIKQQVAQLNQQLNANSSIYKAKVEQAEEQMSFIERDKEHLVLLAPIDGFVENVAAIPKEIAPQYKPLIKLNPIYPNKIRGFMHESAEVHYVLGDTVQISSTLRTQVKTKGIIIGSSPQLVELPLRLRKFTTRSAWGREIYVRLLDNSHLFISEKVLITLNPNSTVNTEEEEEEVEQVKATKPAKIAKNHAVSTRE